jgi:hypothetical protein
MFTFLMNNIDRLWTGRGIGGDAFPHPLWRQPGTQRVRVVPMAAGGRKLG